MCRARSALESRPRATAVDVPRTSALYRAEPSRGGGSRSPRPAHDYQSTPRSSRQTGNPNRSRDRRLRGPRTGPPRSARPRLDREPVSPLRQIAAISAGLVDGRVLLDLAQDEDSRADADLNVEEFVLLTVLLSKYKGQPKAIPFPTELQQLLGLARLGIMRLVDLQRQDARTVQLESALPSRSCTSARRPTARRELDGALPDCQTLFPVTPLSDLPRFPGYGNDR